MLKGSTAHEIIGELRAGNERFLSGKSAQSPDSSLRKLKEFARNGQVPKATVLCCSDSRAPVEMVFDQDIGDLFVIRVAGNIVAPSLIGSVEYAAAAFDVGLVIVMGHTRCGAVTAALQHIATPDSIDSINIMDIVSRITPHISRIAELQNLSFEEQLTLAVEANVLASIREMTLCSKLIKDLVDGGKLYIGGAVLDLDSGFVQFLDSAESSLHTGGY